MPGFDLRFVTCKCCNGKSGPGFFCLKKARLPAINIQLQKTII